MDRMTDDSLDRALGLSQAIEAAAAEGDWLRAAALAEERSPLLMSLSPTQTPQALETIRTIQRIDVAVTEQAKAGRDRLATQHSEAIQRIESVSLYHATGML
jgi:flagellar protein FliT